MSEQKVPSSEEGAIDYLLFTPEPDLPVIDEQQALEACGDWAFLYELLQDVLKEREEMMRDFHTAVETNDHKLLVKAGHTVKGVAFNLHLPGLSDACKKIEAIGKQLEVPACRNDARLLSLRPPALKAVAAEYDRLEKLLPLVQSKVGESSL